MSTTQSKLNNREIFKTGLPNGNSKRQIGGGDAAGKELIAAAKADTDRLRQLISNGANVNYRDWCGNTALNWAAIHGHVDNLRYCAGM